MTRSSLPVDRDASVDLNSIISQMESVVNLCENPSSRPLDDPANNDLQEIFDGYLDGDFGNQGCAGSRRRNSPEDSLAGYSPQMRAIMRRESSSVGEHEGSAYPNYI